MARNTAAAITAITLIGVCNVALAFGQGGTISGIVMDVHGTPVAGAIVSYETPRLIPAGMLAPAPPERSLSRQRRAGRQLRDILPCPRNVYPMRLRSQSGSAAAVPMG
jgi:hypothetical protein